MSHARLNKNLKTDIWTEYAATVAKLISIMVKPHGKCAYENFYGKIPDNKKYLKNFGLMVVLCI